MSGFVVSVHRDRRQFVGQGGGDGGVLVGHHRQAFAVGAVDRVEGLFGIELEALDLGGRGRGQDLGGLDRPDLDEIGTTKGGKGFRRKIGCHQTTSVKTQRG